VFVHSQSPKGLDQLEEGTQPPSFNSKSSNPVKPVGEGLFQIKVTLVPSIASVATTLEGGNDISLTTISPILTSVEPTTICPVAS